MLAEALADKYGPAFGPQRRGGHRRPRAPRHRRGARARATGWPRSRDAWRGRSTSSWPASGTAASRAPWPRPWAGPAPCGRCSVLSLLGVGAPDADEAYVDELGVAAWARRRGVGRALLAACEAEARRAGRDRLTLWVTIDNAAARALYEGCGFRESWRRALAARAHGVRLAGRHLHGEAADPAVTSGSASAPPGSGGAGGRRGRKLAGAPARRGRARSPGVHRAAPPAPPRRRARGRRRGSPSRRRPGRTARPPAAAPRRAMPGPVSRTVTSTSPPGRRRPASVIVPPRGVNVAELATSSERISCTRAASVRTGGRSAGRSVSSRRPRSRRRRSTARPRRVGDPGDADRRAAAAGGRAGRWRCRAAAGRPAAPAGPPRTGCGARWAPPTPAPAP